MGCAGRVGRRTAASVCGGLRDGLRRTCDDDATSCPRVGAGEARFDGRELRAAALRLGEIVVGGAGVVIAELVGVAVLDGCEDALAEADRVGDVIAIDRLLA